MEAEIRQKKTRLLRPLQEKLEGLEAEISRLETEKTDITTRLEQPETTVDTDAVMELTMRFSAGGPPAGSLFLPMGGTFRRN